MLREGRTQTFLLGGHTQDTAKDSFPRAGNQCSLLDCRGGTALDLWGSGLCALRHSMALQVPARDTRRDMDSQELLLGDGTGGRLQMGRDRLGHWGCWHPGALMMWIGTGCCGALTQGAAPSRAQLLGEAGGGSERGRGVLHLAVVQQRHGGGVALVPVVGVAGLRLLARVALLHLVDHPTQLNFCGFAVSAAGRDGKYKWEELDEKMPLL